MNGPVILNRATAAAIDDVMHERCSQLSEKGHAPEWDDTYTKGELVNGAIAYCDASVGEVTEEDAADVGLLFWPWPPETFKPRDKRSNLVRAAALIIAEIERLDRTAHRASDHQVGLFSTAEASHE